LTTLTLAEALDRISEMPRELDAIRPRVAVNLPLHGNTHDFYFKTNIQKELQNLWKWVEIILE
jgi:hypothetical protein